VEALIRALGGYTFENAWDLDALRRRADEVWERATYKVPVEEDRVKPQDVVRALAARLGAEDLVVTDASLSSGWIASHWRVQTSGRRVLAPRGLAGLGWGLPAAVGAAFAMRDGGRQGRVVCLAGDGGWGYSSSEIETLVRFRLPVVSIVLNNRVLGWNKHVAMRRYPDAWVSQDFLDVKWCAAAEALGAWAVRVERTEDLGRALDSAFSHTEGPAVVEVSSSEFETPVLKAMSGAVPAEQAAY
jgi:acetolactate synthase-1/2/3 large subunit